MECVAPELTTSCSSTISDANVKSTTVKRGSPVVVKSAIGLCVLLGATLVAAEAQSANNGLILGPVRSCKVAYNTCHRKTFGYAPHCERDFERCKKQRRVE